ncbi:STAS domain-containing protein [Lentzea sp. DG1S-22]|uniref:STAS domain-containing protein n=1 Tax=Lentzea sp. DG1S-22 TaxID=3108822 RepID=UPI002E792A1F|nr:STAS domain-containing protein [Lentzea sp. DG1S-22]WVH82042.1 STAS domain-containing protein [Lentzea sp. DG1S-22]
MTEPNDHAPISVQTSQDETVPVTAVAGEIDMSTADLVRDEVHARLAAKPDVLVLDLSAVEFIGSAGVHLLVHSQMEAEDHGTRLAVVVPEQSFASRVLRTAGVHQMLDLHTDLPSAMSTR